jgi:hypothetical protein
MKKLSAAIVLVTAALALVFCNGSEESPCDEYMEMANDCTAAYCSGKSCTYCECFRQGKAYNPHLDACEDPPANGPGLTDEQCRQAIEQFDCSQYTVTFDLLCQ